MTGADGVTGAGGVTATVTWIGHATVLIEVAGYRIITDPTLTSRVAHLRRRRVAPAVGPVDTVLISHLHLDHLHQPSLRTVPPRDRVLVPAGAASLLPSSMRRGEPAPGDTGRDRAPLVVDVRPGDEVVLTAAPVPITVEVVHAEHSSGRGPHTRIRAAPVGYVVRVGSASLYFAGDTDLFAAMRDLERIDVALIPIWGWGPSLGERHLDPVSAATATHWIQPRRVVPIHWGTYSPMRVRRGDPPWLEHPLPAFRSALGRLGLTDRLHPVEPGGSFSLEV